MFLGQKIEMQMAHYTLVCHEFYAPGMNDIYVWGSALHDKARTDYRSAYSGLCWGDLNLGNSLEKQSTLWQKHTAIKNHIPGLSERLGKSYTIVYPK